MPSAAPPEVKVDVAVVGAPFLDLTFEGLTHLPALREEVIARKLHVAPGGTGMQALGAARLGLTTALVAPMGRTSGAGLLRGFLETEGVEVVGRARRSSNTGASGSPDVPVTALLTTSEGVAMATVLQCDEPAAAEVADVGARAVVVSLGRLALAPPRARIYAVTGGIELGRVGEMTRERLGGVCALILNQAEAVGLTGRADPQEAAIELAGRVETVVITLGDAGALGCAGDEIVFAPAPVVDAVDATGAGDLFTAGYVWADLHGAPLEDRLAWASLYAGISVRAPTAHAGAVALRELLAEGELLGLTPPGQAGR